MNNCQILKKLQFTELEMFKVFISVCKQLGLNYYLIGGTLLGAVRHGGFIPWDDDIDIAMPRKDYDIFVKQAQSYMPDYYFVQTRETDPEFPHCFMKIRDSRTTFIESSVISLNINHGIYIDVFPLELHPDTKLKQFLFNMCQKLLSWRIASIFSNRKKTSVAKKIIKAPFLVLLYIIFPKVQSAISLKEKLNKCVRRSSMMGNHSSAWGNKEIAPIEWFGEGTVLWFEGLEVRVPCEYDKWLTQVYGDYMQLPPEEKRTSHHYTDVIFFDVPYSKYLKSDSMEDQWKH